MDALEPRTLRHGSADQIVDQMRRHFDEPVGQVAFTAMPIAGMTRRIKLQVKDRTRKDWSGRWHVDLFITPTLGGDPSASGNTVAFAKGVVLTTYLAHGAYAVLSATDGMVEFDLTLGASGQRIVYAQCAGGRYRDSAAFAF